MSTQTNGPESGQTSKVDPRSPAEELRKLDDQLALIRAAALNNRGQDQRMIAVAGLKWVTLMLEKNWDYGSAVWEPPILVSTMSPKSAILVRMSDKISRLRTLLKPGRVAEVKESIDDTIEDLGAYCLLYRAAPEEKEEEVE